MNDDWRNNPKLAGMDRSKLDMLQNLASQGSSKGANEMLPFLMSAAAQGKKGGLKFNADEISAIIEVLKMGKSPRLRKSAVLLAEDKEWRLLSSVRGQN